jgi:hypothetical protein
MLVEEKMLLAMATKALKQVDVITLQGLVPTAQEAGISRTVVDTVAAMRDAATTIKNVDGEKK